MVGRPLRLENQAMLLLSRPSEDKIRAFLSAQQSMPFSYAEVGATRGKPPPGYAVNHRRVKLGSGGSVFARALDALQRWTMFDLPWITFCWPTTPIEPGSLVAVVARTYGIWSINACRVVYTLEEQGELERCGFAYGTLPGHVERGEERFTVEWYHSDNTVWYEILAYARPAHPLVKAAAPLGRLAQKRFARESAHRMLRAAA